MKSDFLKRIVTLFCVMCITFTFVVSVSADEADPSAFLSLSVSSSGNAVTAVVDLTNTKIGLSGIDFKLSFDNTKVRYTGASGSIFGFSFTDAERANHKGYVKALGSLNSGATTATGTIATFTFSLNDGVTGDVSFSLISGSCSDTDGNSLSLALPEPTGLRIETYKIAVNNSANGSITSNVSESSSKGTITLTTKANDGYVLDKVSVVAGSDTVAVISNGNTHTFTMPASDVTVSATFKANSTMPTQSKNENNNTSSQGKNENNTISQDKNKNESASAEGVPANYNIVLENTENGTFTAEYTSAAADTIIHVTTSPNEGYQVNTITITDVAGNLLTCTGENNTYEFVMPASDVTVAVSFEQIPEVIFNVSVSEMQYGKVNLSKNTAGAGSTVTITTVPDAGYKVATVDIMDTSGNAVDVTGTENVYTFTMPEADATVSVTFEELPSESEPQETEPESNPTWLWFLPVILVVLLAVLLVILMTKKKKYQPKY